ncbi:ribosomal protein S18 acetylase RimI-like enzyme [Halarchaeum rubridurum]|uniref:N-acetyltransferase n=1 Tax=Halarchaeum rubridurum TaxID=489911 RepID=A0A830FXP0_9EURY|nr:N-acetyltransferase [Halarchaeum rubridurum]MBP1953666.1 ribosomal protein S18 acetylase RimI-like enzyme [Halarchaeum rubridurum]GGM53717.1 N-acetyltransferase [Halarchaeum rubridurum]
MSVTVEQRVVPRGSDEFLGDAWDLKERIREREGLLRQRHGFFADAYRRATVYAYVTPDEDLVGFAAARHDGYILFLAVDVDYRGEGFGERLVATVAEGSKTVSCHARVSNDAALGFYRHLGFEIVREIDNYYEDGEGAYYLRLGESERLRDRLSEYLRR